MVEKTATPNATQRGETIKALGETIMRKDLYSDPIRNKEIEEEATKAAEKREKRNVEQKEFRGIIRETVID